MSDVPLEKLKKFFTPFTIINIVVFSAVVVSNFYFFYFKRDFPFLIEVSCDPNKEQRFERDCSNPDDCPPNGLSVFKRYSLNANDFKYCENEDCKDACETMKINCIPTACVEDPNVGEACVSPEIGTSNINQNE
jgi:hypothetical protein